MRLWRLLRNKHENQNRKFIYLPLTIMVAFITKQRAILLLVVTCASGNSLPRENTIQNASIQLFICNHHKLYYIRIDCSSRSKPQQRSFYSCNMICSLEIRKNTVYSFPDGFDLRLESSYLHDELQYQGNIYIC